MANQAPVAWVTGGTGGIGTAICRSLADAGYLYEPRARGGYYPSSRWQQLSEAFTEAEPVPEALRRIIVRLGEETGETTWISAPNGQ